MKSVSEKPKQSASSELVKDLPERPLTPQEFADFLGMSRRFLENEVSAGRLRARKLSRRAVRFFRADIVEWLQKAGGAE